MEFNDTLNTKIIEKSKYKHTRTLSDKEYSRLIVLLNKNRNILILNDGCEKIFVSNCIDHGMPTPECFSFFDFCLLMATIARDELISANENVNDDFEMMFLMGAHMMPYKSQIKD